MATKPVPIRRRRTAMKPGTDRERGGQVQSLVRALSIVNALAEQGDGLNLTDLAQTLGLAPSTAHRLLTTLQQERFVRFDPTANLWQVGVQAFIAGNAFVRTRDVVALARPVMRRLMEDSGETVNIAVEDQGEAVYMGQVECRQMMRTIARPGGRVKLHSSGIGKAILASLPAGDVARVLQRHGLPRATERTLDTPQKVKADLEQARQRGWAIDDEEHSVGVRCVAAAVLDEGGSPLAGLSLSGPSARITDDKIAVLGRLVMRAAAEITAEVGGRTSDRPRSATP